jgi:hypothetical protein
MYLVDIYIKSTYKHKQRKTTLTNATCFYRYSIIGGDLSCILTSREKLVLPLIHIKREKYSAVVTHPMAIKPQRVNQ